MSEDIIKSFLPARSGRAVDHAINTRDRAIGLTAATMGVSMLSESDRVRLAELQKDPSLATRPATAPSQGKSDAPKQTVKEFVAGMPDALREKVYEELIASGDFLPAETTQENADWWDAPDVFDDEEGE